MTAHSPAEVSCSRWQRPCVGSRDCRLPDLRRERTAGWRPVDREDAVENVLSESILELQRDAWKSATLEDAARQICRKSGVKIATSGWARSWERTSG